MIHLIGHKHEWHNIPWGHWRDEDGKLRSHNIDFVCRCGEVDRDPFTDHHYKYHDFHIEKLQSEYNKKHLVKEIQYYIMLVVVAISVLVGGYLGTL